MTCSLYYPLEDSSFRNLSLKEFKDGFLTAKFHTCQCKSTGGCYNELVVATCNFSTGAGVKWRKGKKPIPVDLMNYL